MNDSEIERAVALIETDFVASMQAAGERADKLSLFATYFGDPNLLNEQVDRYRGVSTNDVNSFVQNRLGPDNRASLLYVPHDGEAEAEAVADLAASGA